MLKLQISMPLVPVHPGRPKRLVYRVFLDSGREITVPQLAARLKIPRSTILRDIRDAGMSVGTHEETFVALLAAARGRMRKPRADCVCPRCGGSGKVPSAATP